MVEKLNSNEKFQIAIESGLQLIPYVGSALSTAYFSTKQEKRFKRIETFYKELAEKVEQFGEIFTSFENHDTESLMSIIEILNEKIEQEHSQQKREYFKNYFINILKTPTLEYNYDKRRIFLETLANMTLLEFQVLLTFYENTIFSDINRNGNSSIIQGVKARLEMYGFLESSYRAITTAGISPINKNIRITEFGKEFIEFCID